RVTGISAACNAALRAHSWPGNVRELQNVIERAIILASDGEDLQPEHLGMAPLAGAVSASGQAAALGAGGDTILPLSELEKRAILHAVEKCGGNRTQAAKKLEISIRTL